MNLVQARKEMVEVGRSMARQNLIVAAEGNISMRLGGHHFLVTPAGVAKGSLRVQDLLEIDTHGRSAHGRATSEWPLHRTIYQHRPDVRGICHAHAPWSTAFAAIGKDLDGSLLTETAELLPRVPVAPRTEPGTDALAASVVPFLPDHDAVLLGNHGVVAMGNTLPAAMAMLETVERLAKVTLLSMVAEGGPLPNERTLKALLEDSS